jgi:P-type Cu2+ transporter
MTGAVCRHCGLPVATQALTEFCCTGCAGAYALINDLGLGNYYRRRSLDREARPLRPEEAGESQSDLAEFVESTAKGLNQINLMVEGLHCAACVWLIEALLAQNADVVWGRVNMTTRRLTIRWQSGAEQIGQILAPLQAIGYHLIPYDPQKFASDIEEKESELLRAVAVAGFAAANVMLFSVSIWAGTDMGPATRSFMHWLSALIAMPAILYCIRPFLRSAIIALINGRTNMDVPISIGVIITASMSLYETIHWGEHAYFDSAITLLFFLLIGRYMDSRAKGQARSAVEHLLSLEQTVVTVVDSDGSRRHVKPDTLALGQIVAVSAGERIGVDGIICEGQSEVDTSLITGETMPLAVGKGDQLFAGTLNLTGPLQLSVTAVGTNTLLAEIVRLMELAEQGRARYVVLADRVARYYAPVVHLASVATFLFWYFWAGIAWQQALMNGVAVLIITCPCALALAVPVVQVIASGRLLRNGIILKSATALERLAQVDWVVMDKTGTLTLGKPELIRDEGWGEEDLILATGLAVASRHPLAKALVSQSPHQPADIKGVEEIPGCGLIAGQVRLGNRAHAGVALDQRNDSPGPELWLTRPDAPAVCFRFTDEIKMDAKVVVGQLSNMAIGAEMLSGDRSAAVSQVAGQVGLPLWQGEQQPAMKVARLQQLKAQHKYVLMVGDGLNDAPALSAAHVSMSPSSAIDVTRMAADVVFQGERLGPVIEALVVARKARILVAQNFGLAIMYNLVTVPMAMLGYVTPLIAAIAMSTSSLVVILNALRLTPIRKK